MVRCRRETSAHPLSTFEREDVALTFLSSSELAPRSASGSFSGLAFGDECHRCSPFRHPVPEVGTNMGLVIGTSSSVSKTRHVSKWDGIDESKEALVGVLLRPPRSTCITLIAPVNES